MIGTYLQGPALSLARLRYTWSLEPVHVAIVLISIIFIATNAICIPLQELCCTTHGGTTKQHIWSDHKTTHTWRGTGLAGGGEWGVSFVCLLHDKRCGCVCVASKECTSFLDTIIYSLKDIMGTTTSLNLLPSKNP
jgi:hypothetical protein